MEGFALPERRAISTSVTSHYFAPPALHRVRNIVPPPPSNSTIEGGAIGTPPPATPHHSTTPPLSESHKENPKDSPTPKPTTKKRGRPRSGPAITASISKVLQSAAALQKTNSIAFRYFNPMEHLTGAERVGIIGLPGMGKSSAVKSLLYQLQSNFATVLVISGSETDNNFYAACVPKLFIQNSVAPKVLKMLINRQRLVMNSGNKHTHTLLILDDVMDNPKALDNPGINLLYKQGRHVNVSVWLIQQYPMDVKPFVRTTTSAVFLFHTGNTDARRKLYEIYGSGVFRDFQEFDHVFSYITSTHRHTAMVILPNAPAGALGLAGCVFWYRARMDLPKFQAGHPAIWQYAKERTDETKTRDMALLSTTEFGD